MGKIIIGTILIAWGIGALLGISIMKFVFALILIAIGVRIITNKRFDSYTNFSVNKSTSDEEFINEVNIFSSTNKSFKSSSFKGGKIAMIFSGGKIDLTQVVAIENNITIEAVSVFGGLEIIIPKGWKVNSEGASVFGGFDTKIEGDGGEVTLNIKGVAIFGGVKIIN